MHLHRSLHDRSALTQVNKSRFILLIHLVRPDSTLGLTSHRIRLVTHSFRITSRSLRVSTDLNVTVFPNGNRATRRLLVGTSTTVCRTGNTNGGNCDFFSTSVGDGTHGRLRLLRSLHTTLSRRRFHLCCRPGFSTDGKHPINTRTLLH